MQKMIANNISTLVTGGAGFIGSHLCERLVKEGQHVVCVDNLFTGCFDNIRHLQSNNKTEFRQRDVKDPIDGNFSVIYNLACPASPAAYQSDPISTLKTSVMGAVNVLDTARRTNATVFQASTSEVYGDPAEHPQRETYCGNVNPTGIRACYDEGKRCAETLFFDYNRVYQTDIRVGRIFNTYGPRMQINDGRVVSNFITQALRNEPITIYGTGEQTRSFCYIDDMIDAIINVTEQDLPGPFNLGNPFEIKILELVDIIFRLTNSRSKIEFRALPQDDPIRRKPDISRVTSATKWSPKVSIEDGLKETINYFKALIK